MKILRRTAACWAAVLSLAAPAVAHSDPAGFSFLEIPAGARASALGGAYASRALGVEAAFWNPAGLAATHGVQIVASHYEFGEAFSHLRLAQFGFAEPMFGGGASISLRAQYSEPIAETDEVGNQIGTFGYHGIELAVGYGRDLGSGLSAGATTQVVRERIAESSATAWALNGGVAWEPPAFQRLRLSASVHNLGTSPSFNKVDESGASGEPVKLPAAMQLGASYAIPAGGFEWHPSIETRMTRGWTGIGMVGLEATHSSGAGLEIGYRMNDQTTSLSYGVGFARQAMRFDYAFVPYAFSDGGGDLGDTHRFSVAFQF
jgi:hypothetical protein